MDFVILKVNGEDLSESSHEDTVKAFYSAQQPITVEVLRRPAGSQPEGSFESTDESSRSMISGAVDTRGTVSHAHCCSDCLRMQGIRRHTQTTQTDQYLLENVLFQRYFQAPSPPPLIRNDLVFDDQASHSTSDQSYELGGDDSSLGIDMEYEEICLRRTGKDRIGLTLCYGPPDSMGVTDIFIGEVEHDSIAGADGRIHEGDQILQINGTDVHTREEAIKLFSEKTLDITLLVCRPSIQLDDGFVDESNCIYSELEEPRPTPPPSTSASHVTTTSHVTTPDKQQPLNNNNSMSLSLIAEEENSKYEEDSLLTDTATLPSQKEKEGKDSGVGHDSDRLNESSDQDYDCSIYQTHNANCTGEHEYQELEPSNNFRHVLQARCSANNEKIIDLETLYKQMDALCRLIEQQQVQYAGTMDANNSRGGVPRMGTRLMSNGDSPSSSPSKSSDNSPDSTYKPTNNTRQNDSYDNAVPPTKDNVKKEPQPARSNTGAMTLELGKNNMGSMLSLVSENHYEVISIAPSVTEKLPPPDRKEYTTPNYMGLDLPHPSQLKSKSQEGRRSRESSASSSRKNSSSKTKSRRNSDSTQPSVKPKQSGLGKSSQSTPDIAYTNRENLALTIALQQKLLLEQANKSQAENYRSVSTNGNTTILSDHNHNLEWVVKKRSDGTRYVTRRPIRNKILSERKKRVEDERCGMTTDDDAMSEIKTGRYWSKEDRKTHLQKAKEYRKRKELLRNKMTPVREVEERKSSSGSAEKVQTRKSMRQSQRNSGESSPQIIHNGSKSGLNSNNNNSATVLSVTTV